ncbi:Hypothetical protein, putative [Bodo saltans]|uniref:Uncharacterized protein n=1 Tax=Bodo saltans TaxID=75058 RepID=A0A0S4JH40_BODSA|nr:Hypothetical protein, putative [Bodo saltans]|eukprot:CUG87725.1 Hypothetical protein, putative [Bodo saltans]
MLRRCISTRLTAASQTRSFSIADIELTSLLPIEYDRVARRAFSVNDYIKQHKLPISPIEVDKSLTAWARLSAREKKVRMPRFADFDDHPSLEEATRRAAKDVERQSTMAKEIVGNKVALNILGRKGIHNLDHFSRCDPASLGTVESDIVQLLNNSLQDAQERVEHERQLLEWLDSHVKAFKKRVHPINSTDTAPESYATHLRMRELTHRHSYGAKGNTMLGGDRRKTLDAIVDHAFTESRTKEGNKINYVVAAPRQGKSLMLTEVVAEAPKRGRNFYGVTITFTGDTPLYEAVTTVRDVSSQFWGRVVHSLYCAMLPEKTAAPQDSLRTYCFDEFKAQPFFKYIDKNVAYTLAGKLGLGRVVIAADEISRLIRCIKQWPNSCEKENAMSTITSLYGACWSLVCSGFTVSDADAMCTRSDRGTEPVLLFTLSKDTRGDFALMRECLKEAYPGRAFTPARRGLYEIVKNVPGYCGLWIEARDKFLQNVKGFTRDVSGISDLHTPTIEALGKPLSTNSWLLSDFWRAEANRHTDVLEVVHRDFFRNLERSGAVLPGANMDDKMRFLCPLAYTHPALNGAREYDLILFAVNKLHATGDWTLMEKGKALAAILLVRLALTAAYVNDPIARSEGYQAVTVRTLISRLCGKIHTTVSAKRVHSVDESLPAKFPDYTINISLAGVSKSEVQNQYDAKYTKDTANSATGMAIVKDLSAFPAVWSEALGKKRSTKKQEERLEENIAALNSPHFSVLSPQCPMNPGCDVAMLLRAGEK